MRVPEDVAIQIVRLGTDGLDKVAIAKRYGVTRRTVNRWVRLMAGGGASDVVQSVGQRVGFTREQLDVADSINALNAIVRDRAVKDLRTDVADQSERIDGIIRDVVSMKNFLIRRFGYSG